MRMGKDAAVVGVADSTVAAEEDGEAAPRAKKASEAVEEEEADAVDDTAAVPRVKEHLKMCLLKHRQKRRVPPLPKMSELSEAARRGR